MPSLGQLEEFRTSFRDVGGEALITSNNQLPMDDLELPGSEPPAPFPEDLTGSPSMDFEPDMPTVDDLGLDLPPESFSGTTSGDTADTPLPDIPGQELDGDFGFGDLLGSIPEETPDPPPIPDMAAPDISMPDMDMPGMDGIDIPDTAVPDMDIPGMDGMDGSGMDMLNVPSVEIPEGPPAEPAESVSAGTESEFAGMEFPDIDLSEAMDMGGEFRETTPEDSDGTAGASDDIPADTSPDVPADVPADSSGNGDTDSFDTGFDSLPDLAIPDDFGALESGSEPEPAKDGTGGETPEEAPGAEPEDSEISGLDLSGFDAAVPGDTESTEPVDTDTGFDTPDFDTTDFDTGSGDILDLGGESGDSFDDFNPEGEWKPPEEPLDTPDFSTASAEDDFDNFSLPGFDEAVPGKAAGGRSGPAGFPAAEDVEEIRLSEEDYKQLQETLSAYPLNLRIACEELIAEKAVAPDLMSALIKLLVRGAPAKETAALAGKILGQPVSIPKGYAKQTGADLEAEQASFGYIFVRRFLPVLRLVGLIGLVLASLAYLSWRFVVVPLQAESLYKQGYAMIQAGEYTQANEQFRKGFEKHRVKNWFYRYAEAFRDDRQYIYAERKYDELLRVYPRDKKGALDYAYMESYYRINYEKADRIIRHNILDYAINDREGLMALAENNLAWGETEPSRYEDARAAYARLMEKYGRQDPYLEGMLKYFIRTDQLTEVLPLQAHFMSDPKKRKITVPTLAELGGYLLDKRFEEAAPDESPRVPEEYADKIEGIRDVLLRAIKADETYPESYYHLARYYNHYDSPGEEQQTLRDALRLFAAAEKETPRRAAFRVDAHRRYAELLINAGEFFPAEEELIRGVRLYEDARTRQVLKTRPLFGRLYADLGDLEFFVKNGDMGAALRFYEEGERNGWAPPEIQYRMGAAHYQMEQWEEALQRFFVLVPAMPHNKRLLYALGNTSYLRGNYFAAQAYYNQLMNVLDVERIRFPNLAPGSRPEEQDLAERIMVVNNNMGVTLEALAQISGDTGYRSRALGFLSESIRAWDVLTRNPETMTRMRPFKDLYGPGVNLAYLNVQNILRPELNYEQQIFMRIDRDALEPSTWERIVPRGFRLSDQLMTAE